jgi:hypothetical protein
MIAVLARLGRLLFGLGILFSAVIIVIGAAIIAYWVWIDGNPNVSILEKLWSQGHWIELVFRGLIGVPIGCLFNLHCLLTTILTALLFIGLAAIPLGLGAACCYVLGGFNKRTSTLIE